MQGVRVMERNDVPLHRLRVLIPSSTFKITIN